MSAIQSLENAILERIRKQEAFKETVKATLTRAFNSLPVCNGKDEVSDTININREKLESLLQKLHNDKSLNKEAVKQLIDRTNIKDLKKGSNSKFDPRSSDSSYYTANGSPRPSEVDGAIFSQDRSSTSSAKSSLTGPSYTPASTSPEYSLDGQLNPMITGNAVPRPSEFHYGGKRFKSRRKRR
jgi:hypothetical protein